LLQSCTGKSTQISCIDPGCFSFKACEATALQSFGDSAPWEHLAGVGFVTCPIISSDFWNVFVVGLGESS